ncbi:MAG TPA: hypothetical protein VMV44_11890 [Rectinemataceae bacterium]|nr:hypothetical protein [Rectinemataceae bacterium]
MTTLLDILALAILLFIAAELYVISRELGRLSRNLPGRLDSKEGQTINVNLGQLPVTGIAAEAPVPVPVSVPEKADAKPIEEVQEEALPIAEPEAPPPAPPHYSGGGSRATASGLVALKCPKCQAENSVYRTECFNCGEKL